MDELESQDDQFEDLELDLSDQDEGEDMSEDEEEVNIAKELIKDYKAEDGDEFEGKLTSNMGTYLFI